MIVKFSIGKSDYQISCPENQQDQLLSIVKKVDEKFCKLSSHLKNADEKTLLAICCLTLQDEVENVNKSDNELKKDFAQTLDPIKNKLESLAKKIENC